MHQRFERYFIFYCLGNINIWDQIGTISASCFTSQTTNNMQICDSFKSSCLLKHPFLKVLLKFYLPLEINCIVLRACWSRCFVFSGFTPDMEGTLNVLITDPILYRMQRAVLDHQDGRAKLIALPYSDKKSQWNLQSHIMFIWGIKMENVN